MHYTGIGSRKTPSKVLPELTKIALYLSDLGYTLRSGAAVGADMYFEKGSGDNSEIYLPWKGFNKHLSDDFIIPEWAFETVSKYHPNPDSLTQITEKLMARNAMQVLGYNGDSPSNFVICWTEGGWGGGGTGQALRIAKDYKIPILDLGKSYSHVNMFDLFKTFMKIRVDN